MPQRFLEHVRSHCDRHGIVLILDEVQSGVARCGQFWASELVGVQPDVMTFAKGIASGLPLAGVAASKSIFDKLLPNALGGTYGGNGVCMAAANATLDVIQDEDLCGNARRTGDRLRRGLEEIQGWAGSPIVGLRQYGLFIGVDFDPQACTSAAVMGAALKENIIVIGCGKNGIRILPPLVITEQECDEFLEGFAKAVRAAGR